MVGKKLILIISVLTDLVLKIKLFPPS